MFIVPDSKEERIMATNYERTQLDLGINDCGYQLKNPVKNGPLLFGHNSLHFCYEGEGFICVDNKTFKVGEGQFFLTPSGSVSVYYPNPVNPWKYAWVGIYGLESEKYLSLAGLGKNNPVISSEKNIVMPFYYDIFNLITENTLSSRTKALALLYGMFAAVYKINKIDVSKEKNANEYIRQALFFIHENYMHGITVSDICKKINLNRTYFSGIFKQYTKFSPVRYLLDTRISNAAKLLKETELSITEISALTGFKDSVNFSIQFKKRTGLSPQKYRFSPVSDLDAFQPYKNKGNKLLEKLR